jgi:dihydroorotate dehydrogenase electron transfer subunit
MPAVRITKIVSENPITKTFYFDTPFQANPGQFAMVWIPGVDEKPMSFSGRNSITIKAVGPFSKRAFKLTKGEMLGLRGPYGRGFEFSGKHFLLVGGGFGVAPLKFFAEEAFKRKMNLTTVLGFKTKQDALFMSEFEKLGELVVCTEDGSCGICGLVLAGLADLQRRYDCAYVCGPETMMREVRKRLRIRTQYLLERYMKCGIGVCGSCEINGMLVCRDGPMFWEHELPSSFGTAKRDECGRKIFI